MYVSKIFTIITVKTILFESKDLYYQPGRKSSLNTNLRRYNEEILTSELINVGSSGRGNDV